MLIPEGVQLLIGQSCAFDELDDKIRAMEMRARAEAKLYPARGPMGRMCRFDIQGLAYLWWWLE
jgi:hypothetical protein